jgi:hypothetical protein
VFYRTREQKKRVYSGEKGVLLERLGILEESDVEKARKFYGKKFNEEDYFKKLSLEGASKTVRKIQRSGKLKSEKKIHETPVLTEEEKKEALELFKDGDGKKYYPLMIKVLTILI